MFSYSSRKKNFIEELLNSAGFAVGAVETTTAKKLPYKSHDRENAEQRYSSVYTDLQLFFATIES